MRRKQAAFDFRTWGGRRRGAGRKPAGVSAGVPHCRRPLLDHRHPVHLTLRAVRGLPSLRAANVFTVVRSRLAASSRQPFRIVHFSVQTNHVHLLVEAAGTAALGRGVQGLTIRLAKAVNRLLGRHGRVWADRYHARALRTPSEVRRGLVYVLLNGRKHGVCRRGIDPCSSGAWFQGWRERVAAPPGLAPVVRARTWLLSVGWWRRSRPISVEDGPARREP